MLNPRVRSWHELRVTVPADAEVIEPDVQHPAIRSLKIYGADMSEDIGSTFYFSAMRQILTTPLTLQEWSDSIIDLAADRRLRIPRRLGDHDVILAVPNVEEPIGTFVFAVVDGHGYNIMAGAAHDAVSQAEIAEILESLLFLTSDEEGTGPNRER